MTQIKPQDLAAALEPRREPDPSEFDALALTQRAMRILYDRMETDPEGIPAGQLLRLAEQLAKLELARLEKAPPEALVTESVLEIVRSSNLPDERKKELLLTERERLQEQLELVHLELEEL